MKPIFIQKVWFITNSMYTSPYDIRREFRLYVFRYVIRTDGNTGWSTGFRHVESTGIFDRPFDRLLLAAAGQLVLHTARCTGRAEVIMAFYWNSFLPVRSYGEIEKWPLKRLVLPIEFVNRKKIFEWFKHCTVRKERKKCVRMGLNFEAQKVLKRNCWARDRESCVYMCKFRCMHDIDVRSHTASTSWGIPRRFIALVLSLFSHTIHPQIPLGQEIW